MLIDRQRRIIGYLRISVTDRCNFRCVYCMPAEGVELVPRSDVLSYEEIARVARVGAGLGLSKVRITGGEPTVRRDLPALVALLHAVPGIREIALTTNGARLGELAAPLKAAGLTRVNISIDTLRPERASEIARRDLHADALRGIEAAIAAGLRPLKLNAVVMRGVNDDELIDLVQFSHARDAQMRFIEYMPMGQARLDKHNQTVTGSEMRAILATAFDLVPEPHGELNDPAKGWICRRSGARVGFVSSISENFCSFCNRMRLTATGGLRPCLHQDAEIDVRTLLRQGGSDAEIAAAYGRAAALKWDGHHLNDFVPLYSIKEMVAIGG